MKKSPNVSAKDQSSQKAKEQKAPKGEAFPVGRSAQGKKKDNASRKPRQAATSDTGEILSYTSEARVEIRCDHPASMTTYLTNVGKRPVVVSIWTKPDSTQPGIPEDGLLARIPVMPTHTLRYSANQVVNLTIEAEGQPLERAYSFTAEYSFPFSVQSPPDFTVTSSWQTNAATEVIRNPMQQWTTHIGMEVDRGPSYQTKIDADVQATLQRVGKSVSVKSRGGRGPFPTRTVKFYC